MFRNIWALDWKSRNLPTTIRCLHFVLARFWKLKFFFVFFFKFCSLKTIANMVVVKFLFPVLVVLSPMIHCFFSIFLLFIVLCILPSFARKQFLPSSLRICFYLPSLIYIHCNIYVCVCVCECVSKEMGKESTSICLFCFG